LQRQRAAEKEGGQGAAYLQRAIYLLYTIRCFPSIGSTTMVLFAKNDVHLWQKNEVKDDDGMLIDVLLSRT